MLQISHQHGTAFGGASGQRIQPVLLKEVLYPSPCVPSHVDLSEHRSDLASLSSNHHPWLLNLVWTGPFAKRMPGIHVPPVHSTQARCSPSTQAHFLTSFAQVGIRGRRQQVVSSWLTDDTAFLTAHNFLDPIVYLVACPNHICTPRIKRSELPGEGIPEDQGDTRVGVLWGVCL